MPRLTKKKVSEETVAPGSIVMVECPHDGRIAYFFLLIVDGDDKSLYTVKILSKSSWYRGRNRRYEQKNIWQLKVSANDDNRKIYELIWKA